MSLLLRVLLFPLTVLYDAGTRLRNHLFDIGHYPSVRFDVPVISVGNLRAGGAGKTPLVEYIIRLLMAQYRCAVLSRGYGRDTKGLRLAGEGDSPNTLGDEPFQLWKKFNESVSVAVCEDRVYAIPHLVSERNAEVVILDDAFQHRSAVPSLSILVTEYGRPFYKDFVLPSGRLRESGVGARRADVIMVSKCPESLTEKDRQEVEARIRHYAGSKPVCFATLRYSEVIWKGQTPRTVERVLLVTGIENPQPLVSYVSAHYSLARHFRYRDHYKYTHSDVQRILDFGSQLGEPCVMLTTEKDWGKLSAFDDLLSRAAVGVIPVEHAFIYNGAEFDNAVRRAAGGH